MSSSNDSDVDLPAKKARIEMVSPKEKIEKFGKEEASSTALDDSILKSQSPLLCESTVSSSDSGEAQAQEREKMNLLISTSGSLVTMPTKKKETTELLAEDETPAMAGTLEKDNTLEDGGAAKEDSTPKSDDSLTNDATTAEDEALAEYETDDNMYDVSIGSVPTTITLSSDSASATEYEPDEEFYNQQNAQHFHPENDEFDDSQEPENAVFDYSSESENVEFDDSSEPEILSD